ncbi:MAG: hypothetical protein U1E31_01660, partial [Rickettsiales bacterium]
LLQENNNKMLWKVNFNAKNLNLNIYNYINLNSLNIDKDIINYLKETNLSGQLLSLNGIMFNDYNNKININGSALVKNVDFIFDKEMPSIQKATGLIYFNENMMQYLIKTKLSSNLIATGLVTHNYKSDIIDITCSTAGKINSVIQFINPKTLQKLKNKNLNLNNIISDFNCLLNINILIKPNAKNDIKINSIAKILNFNWKNFLSKANLNANKLDIQIKDNILLINDQVGINYQDYSNYAKILYEQDLINDTIAIDGTLSLNNYLLNKFDFFKISGLTDLEFKYRNFNNQNYITIFSNLTNTEFEMQNIFAKKIKTYSKLNAFINIKNNFNIKAHLIADKNNNLNNSKINNNYVENFVENKINISIKPSNKIDAFLEIDYKDINNYNLNALFQFDKTTNLIKLKQNNQYLKFNLLSDFLDISRINFNNFIKSEGRNNKITDINVKIKKLHLFNNIKLTNLDTNINIDQIGHINGDIKTTISNIITIPKNIKNKSENRLSKAEIDTIKNTIKEKKLKIQNKDINKAKMIEEFIELDNYRPHDKNNINNTNQPQNNEFEILFLQEKEKLLKKNNKKLSSKEKILLKNLLNPIQYSLNIKFIGKNKENYIILDTQNAGLLLESIGAYKKLRNGNLNLLCLNILDKNIEKYHSNNLKCNFNMHEFVMTDNSFLTSLVTYVSLSGIIKFLTMNKDYEFNRLVGEFIINDSIANIKAVDSEGIYFDYNTKGIVNLDKKTVNLNGRLIPSFFYLTKITKYIPIIKDFLYKKIFAPFRFNFKY